MNIKNILTIRFSVIVATILMMFSLSVYQFLSIYRDKEFNERLYKRIAKKVDHFINTQKIDSNQFALFYNLQLTSLPHETLHITDENGKFIFSSEIIDKKKIELLKQLRINKKTIRESKYERNFIAFIFQNRGNNYYIVASAVDELGYARMKYLRYLLILLFIAGLAITAISGRYYAHRALKPINQIIKQVDDITATSLHKRVRAANLNDEIGLLAERFNKMLERIEESFKVQKHFVANASHEFATPLTAIKGEIEVLLLQKRNESDYIKTLKSINEEINKQINLLNALRELSDANNDINKKEHFKICSFTEIISDVISYLIQKKPLYNIQLNFIDDEKELFTYGNSSLLIACFSNIIDNACKFSINKKAQVVVEEINNEIKITVSDNGIGISNEDLKHIFEPFYRSNNTRNIDGFGIGLSLVKKVIEIHDGEIFIDTKEGVGTTVVVKLKAQSKNPLKNA